VSLFIYLGTINNEQSSPSIVDNKKLLQTVSHLVLNINLLSDRFYASNYREIQLTLRHKNIHVLIDADQAHSQYSVRVGKTKTNTCPCLTFPELWLFYWIFDHRQAKTTITPDRQDTGTYSFPHRSVQTLPLRVSWSGHSSVWFWVIQ